MKMRIFVLILCLGFVPTVARADVKPSAICSEGMVLQQKSFAKIWGTADKGEQVSVTLNTSAKGAKGSQSAIVKADNDGRWVAVLQTGPAGGPFEMIIEGTNKIVYKNVLVGEVWVCSGQSNMEAKVGQYIKCDDIAYATAAPHNAMLRTFNVERNAQNAPQTDVKGSWIEADPKTVTSFTAVGYFFGRNLQENLKVPVGLIHTSWGGTRIETWISEPALAPFEKPTPNPKNPQNVGAALYNGMIHPILNYRIKGAIWYQGESNASQAFKYRALHRLMIQNWRDEFKEDNFPFYFVQLAPFGAAPKKPGDSQWAELREAQNMTLKLENTGMAVITDLGSEYDIHPTPKRPVGDRLALAARAQTYGEKIVYSGPIYKDAKFEGGKATLTFDHIGGGLASKELVPTLEKKNKDGKPVGAAWRVKEGSSGAALLGFTICGKTGGFQDAKAEIVGDTVVVSSAAVAEPIYVRYGWANHPICNLFNREGLPASPFRTDRIPINGEPYK